MGSCEDCRTSLSAYLDGELGEREHQEVERHLIGCMACGAERDRLGALIDALHSLPGAVPEVSTTFDAVWETVTEELGCAVAGGITCEVAIESLPAYAEGSLSGVGEARIHDHLLDCTSCSRALVEMLATLHALHAVQPVAPRTDPWPRLALQLTNEGLLRRRRRLPRPRAIGWIAAAMVAMVAGGITYQSVNQPPHADLSAYWREHGIFSQAASDMGAPSPEAIEATYQLQGD